MKYTGIYGLFAVLLMAGCTRNLSFEQVDVMEQKVTFALLAKRLAPQIPTESDLPAESTAGVYVTEKDVSITNAYYSNWQYTATTAGTLSSVNRIMLLTVGRNYDIYGYSPYNKDVTNASAIPVSHGMDILWSPKRTITNVSETNNTASLTFQHSMAQVAFNVLFDADLSIPSPIFDASSKIQITGIYGTGTLNAETGIISPTGEANIVLSGLAKGIPGSMTLGIDATTIIPATDMTLVVEVTHGEKKYNGSIKVTPIAGNLINYSVIIRGAPPKVSLGITGTVEDWVNTNAQSDLE